MERVIGRYGKYGAAKTFLVFAGIHGNEKAGIYALQELFKEFEEANVPFDGTVIGIAGNLKAIKDNVRFTHKDLNRQWYLSKIRKLGALPFGMLNTAEDVEQKQILDLILDIVHDKGKKLMLVDLHTTSAKGGSFSITNAHAKSTEYALQIPVPVIDKMITKIKGTTLEYFNDIGLPAIAFEAGQHEDPIAVQRMKAALVYMFYHAGCIESGVVEKYKDAYSEMETSFKNLPKHVEVIYRHPIEEDDKFIMKPGYVNFQSIKKGEVLAHDKHGEIVSHTDGLMLMPLYQSKGEDGFFIVKEV
ncbi:MAG: succinylglutamate desuccinylase/aspartoacylase family protein [Chitinophagales bacterium]|nr:succinylglutamate desuccinylase/aspartoacylase family protein [Chitinophagales bacterium]